MLQFVADQIDQLDLALDQLSVNDRNFDRFAMMLIDNVVELTLHKYAREKSHENAFLSHGTNSKNNPKDVTDALGQSFDAKVKLARSTGMISASVAESIQYLHGFRNVVYHQGRKHEVILHSLAILYFQHACTVLENFKPAWWSSSGKDQISYRAIKYLGDTKRLNIETLLPIASARLLLACNSFGKSLIQDLTSDMDETITNIDDMIDFLATDSPEPTSRNHAIVNLQVWPFAFSEAGKKWAHEHGCPKLKFTDYIEWLTKNYPWQIKSDPIVGWNKRCKSLRNEKDFDAALKKYCDFMRQTEGFRDVIQDSAYQLDAHIQNQIDEYRGK